MYFNKDFEMILEPVQAQNLERQVVDNLLRGGSSVGGDYASKKLV